MLHRRTSKQGPWGRRKLSEEVPLQCKPSVRVLEREFFGRAEGLRCDTYNTCRQLGELFQELVSVWGVSPSSLGRNRQGREQ